MKRDDLPKLPKVSRRSFIVGSAAVGGGLALGLRLPPFGPAAFYLKGVTPPGITLGDIFRSIWPYMGLQVIALGLVIAFPQIALWLPNTMK